ncbi:MAG: glycosyltransferase family 4 protein [Pseudomonadota bacterium]
MIHRPVIGINACRARSGGAVAHLIGLVERSDPERHGFAALHLWAFDGLLARVPDRPWLHKHSTGRWQASVPLELFWERFLLPAAAKRAGIDLLFNVDAGSVCPFRPSVTMSQDMLPFEPGEMERYAAGKARLRLQALRHVQTASLRNADGAIFLTRYAAERIGQATGPLRHVAIVPHGIDQRFVDMPRRASPAAPKALHDCIYISNAAPYKHQWHVVEAIAQLRARGIPLRLRLVGGGSGPAMERLMAAVERHDPARDFVTLEPFVPHAEIPDLLARADIFLFASSCESMPVTLLEGMAAGLPIACSERGPMPDILQDAGAYFNPELPESIADAVGALACNPVESNAYADRAKAIAQSFSWQRCADQTFDFLLSTLKRSHGERAA